MSSTQSRHARASARMVAAVVVVAVGLAWFGVVRPSEPADAMAPPPNSGTPTLAFDACEAPPLDAMRAWRAESPYSSVAVYIGGEMRACRNLALDGPDWIRTVLADGWGVIPVYVGPQAPCTDYRTTMRTDAPAAQGTQTGLDAVARGRAAGLLPGDPIYLDLEPWDQRDEACEAMIAVFLDGYVRAVKQAGFIAGIYSTLWRGIELQRAMEQNPAFVTADVLWAASWNGEPGNLVDIPSEWRRGRKMHQYLGDHVETWGGWSIDIDSNWVDAPVAIRPTPPAATLAASPTPPQDPALDPALAPPRPTPGTGPSPSHNPLFGRSGGP